MKDLHSFIPHNPPKKDFWIQRKIFYYQIWIIWNIGKQLNLDALQIE